ncbi:Wzz/FepE/Etk N-terminal domain-containing protein [Gammaproteobacteria bacterium]|nr:Wzz/FepE/Etk N-terminal domain-containing protein [Gammaproteobacteria bacterium]
MMKIIDTLWNEKLLIIKITACAAVLSVIFSLMLTNYYESESLLVATDTQDSGGVSQLAGLASIAGIGIDGSGDSVIEIIELIRSREFVKHLISFEGILPGIMASESYDVDSKKLFFKDSYNPETNKWNSKPSYLQAHKKYRDKILDISQSKRTGVVSIKIEHISPVFARDLLDLIIKEANTLKRERDLEVSSKALSFLKQELSKTSLVEIRESINTIIEAQLERQMMAKINEDYVLIEIEPPYIPDLKSRPHRAQICILGTLLGGILSVIIVLVRHYFFGKDSLTGST